MQTAPYNIESPVINSRVSSAGEYFVKEGLFSVQDPGSNAKSEVTLENSRPIIIRDASRPERRVIQHLEDEKIEVLDTSSQGKWILCFCIYIKGHVSR